MWGRTYLIFVIFFTQAKFLENKIYTKKRVNCQIFALNLKKFTQAKKNLHGYARGARDKYQVCGECLKMWFSRGRASLMIYIHLWNWEGEGQWWWALIPVIMIDTDMASLLISYELIFWPLNRSTTLRSFSFIFGSRTSLLSYTNFYVKVLTSNGSFNHILLSPNWEKSMVIKNLHV